jgi:hypothetical protein
MGEGWGEGKLVAKTLLSLPLILPFSPQGEKGWHGLLLQIIYIRELRINQRFNISVNSTKSLQSLILSEI